SRRRHTRFSRDWSSDVCSSDLVGVQVGLDNYELQDADVFVAGDKFDGFSGNGAVGGVYAGYDIPLGDTLFAGVEVNASLSGAKKIGRASCRERGSVARGVRSWT